MAAESADGMNLHVYIRIMLSYDSQLLSSFTLDNTINLFYLGKHIVE